MQQDPHHPEQQTHQKQPCCGVMEKLLIASAIILPLVGLWILFLL